MPLPPSAGGASHEPLDVHIRPLPHGVPAGALECSHRALQRLASPVMVSAVQGSLSAQEFSVGQSLPSQVSDPSRMPLPHAALQSLSLFAFAPCGQHPSLARGLVIGVCLQVALQRLASPVTVSAVQGSLSAQEVAVGQSLPSQSSEPSRTPFPHIALQSLSLFAFAPVGQQPSPPLAVVMGVCEHARLQLSALPELESFVHGMPSSQEVGQLPSQSSEPSRTSLPQIALQSLSLFAFVLGGQQPSPPFAAVIATCEHATLHCSGVPVFRSVVHALPSSHELGQGLSLLLGSHSSGASTMPSPQLLEQSESCAWVHPLAQQPSPLLH